MSSSLTREKMTEIICDFFNGTPSDSVITDIISQANRRVNEIRETPSWLECYCPFEQCSAFENKPRSAFKTFIGFAKSRGFLSKKQIKELVENTPLEVIVRSLHRLSNLENLYELEDELKEDDNYDEFCIENHQQMVKSDFFETLEEYWQLPRQKYSADPWDNMLDYDPDEDKSVEELARNAVADAILRAEFIARIRHDRQSWLDSQMSPIAIPQAPTPICNDLEPICIDRKLADLKPICADPE